MKPSFSEFDINFFSKLFGQQRRVTITTTHARPFTIERPVIGFLNLKGEKGYLLLSRDCAALAPMFADCRKSTDVAPECHVLFIYCDFNQNGDVIGSKRRLRDIIKSARTYVTVVATENAVESYIKATAPKNDWPANIVMTLNRKEDSFTQFFHRLFQSMFRNTSMLIAWNNLAPQIPGAQHSECPETIFSAEAGHVIFASTND
ncbi:MAG: hypothetical protein ACYC26_12475 [Phycisphaerales bacterium]